MEGIPGRGNSEAAKFKAIEHRTMMLARLVPEYRALNTQIGEIEKGPDAGKVKQTLDGLRNRKTELETLIRNVGADPEDLPDDIDDTVGQTESETKH